MNEQERAVMQQALEALEAGPDVDPIFAGETEAALRAALAKEQAEPVQEPLVWEPVVLDLPALTQREYDALHADLRWNYKKITPPKVEPKFFDTVLYTGSIERATPVKPAPPGLVGVTTVSSVSVTTQHRVLTDADLDAIRKIVREGGKE